MNSIQFEINKNSSYEKLDQTYCGNNILKLANITYNPPSYIYNKCPADWESNKIPSMSTQIVYKTFQYPNYTNLTHNTEQSSSGYFNMNKAYNDENNGYIPVYRSCHGNLH